MQAAREKLLVVFRQNFEKAYQSRDSNATSRFFKLFPAIGWEAEGLEAYSTFVVDLVRARAPASSKSDPNSFRLIAYAQFTGFTASSPIYYITALTSLFESIAMIVDQHQPVVEKYYGQGKMKSVVDRLLEECDRVTKTLKNGWEEDRSMQRKVGSLSWNNEIYIQLPIQARRYNKQSTYTDVSVESAQVTGFFRRIFYRST